MSKDDPGHWQYHKGYYGQSDGSAWGEIGRFTREQQDRIDQIGRGARRTDGGGGGFGPIGQGIGAIGLAVVAFAVLEAPLRHLGTALGAVDAAARTPLQGSSLAIFSALTLVVVAAWIAFGVHWRFRRMQVSRKTGIVALATVPWLFLLSLIGRTLLEAGLVPQRGFDVGMEMVPRLPGAAHLHMLYFPALAALVLLAGALALWLLQAAVERAGRWREPVLAGVLARLDREPPVTRGFVTALLIAGIPVGLVMAGLPVAAGLWVFPVAGLLLGWRRALPAAAVACLLAAPGLPVESYRPVPEIAALWCGLLVACGVTGWRSAPAFAGWRAEAVAVLSGIGSGVAAAGLALLLLGGWEALADVPPRLGAWVALAAAATLAIGGTMRQRLARPRG